MNVCTETVWLDQPGLALVAEFHKAFNHPIANEQITRDKLFTPLADLRYKLIAEEFKELSTAFLEGNVVDFIDALQDLKYVIYGAELALGVASEEHFSEVHAANMRKLGPDGKPIYREDGKILKPEGWTGPDHETIMRVVDQRGTIYAE